MPKMGGRVFGTPGKQLFLWRSWTQQCAIAAAHQRETVLNQANGPVAQIVRRPIAFRNAPGPEQAFCNFAVGASVHARIERAQGERQSPAAIRRKRMQRRAQRTTVEGSPQAPACIRAEFEIAVQGKFNSVDDRNHRRFLEPNAVLNTAQIQYCVPTVRGLTQLAFTQVAEVQADIRICTRQQRRPHWHDRRQNFRRPEYSLFKEGLVGISCEKLTPNDRETRRLR